MTAYKIGRIRIQNFKSIITFDESFREDMLILDGPNGFGKTTLFDAMELVMYGRIKRIDDYKIIDQKQGYRDPLYINDDRKPALIQVLFYAEDDSFVVTKRLPSSKSNRKKNKGIAANSPTAWERFETYITDDFIDRFEVVEQVSQEDVHQRLDVAHLMRAFHLFYYIQQEEKTYFLRSNEKQRLTELSDLFDTKEEEIERKKLDDIKKSFVKRLNVLSKKDIPVLQSQIEQKKKTQIQQVEQAIPYTPLLTVEALPLWDTALDSVSNDLRKKSHDELDQIKDFLLNVDAYESSRFNAKLNSYLENSKLLEHTIIMLSHLSINATGLREKHQRQNEYRQWLSRLTRQAFVDEIENEGTLDALITVIMRHEWPINVQGMKDLIASIQFQRKNSGKLAEIVVGINDTRNALQVKHQQFLVELNNESNGECPMCGHDWGALDELKDQLSRKQQLFESFYTDAAITVSQHTDELYAKHISVIRERLETFLNNPENTVDATFFEQWEKADKFRTQVESLAEWCHTQSYDLIPYVNQSLVGIGRQQMDIAVTNLREFLRSKKRMVHPDYSETGKKFKEFGSILKRWFANDTGQIRRLSVERIDKKKAYIDSIYYRTNAAELAEFTGKLQRLLDEQRQNVIYRDKVTTIIEKYDASIREHWAKIIGDIEIIFYLYFAKVTQYYQRGLGMFIQQQRESDTDQGIAKTLRFVYRTDSDQDAINYLSSGQLSALVIAFTLALNRVYNRGLGVLLIDDPVQTMDDINMASLTELLRNDFKDMQIILSTHEDQVARYLKYKFLKYGLSAERLNMKDKSLGLPKPTMLANN